MSSWGIRPASARSFPPRSRPWLEQHYASNYGMADLYVNFYELGMKLLSKDDLYLLAVLNSPLMW